MRMIKIGMGIINKDGDEIIHEQNQGQSIILKFVHIIERISMQGRRRWKMQERLMNVLLLRLWKFEMSKKL